MKKLLLVFIMMAIWIVASCTKNYTNSDRDGCYGFWEKNRYGLQRGTRSGWNTDYKKPYRQCVDDDKIHLNKEQRPYG